MVHSWLLTLVNLVFRFKWWLLCLLLDLLRSCIVIDLRIVKLRVIVIQGRKAWPHSKVRQFRLHSFQVWFHILKSVLIVECLVCFVDNSFSFTSSLFFSCQTGAASCHAIRRLLIISRVWSCWCGSGMIIERDVFISSIRLLDPSEVWRQVLPLIIDLFSYLIAGNFLDVIILNTSLCRTLIWILKLAEVRKSWVLCVHRYRLEATSEILMTAATGCIQLIDTCIGMQGWGVPCLIVRRSMHCCIELRKRSLVLLVVPWHEVFTTSIVVPLAIH